VLRFSALEGRVSGQGFVASYLHSLRIAWKVSENCHATSKFFAEIVASG
jgi:hypothetical protein